MGVGAMRAQRAFTLIEMLVVIVIAGVVLALAAPSFRDMIAMQRLRSVTAQLVTDFQFARAEAAARNEYARIAFRGTAAFTCYTIYTSTLPGERCDCRQPIGSACTNPSVTTEIRTQQVPRDRRVSLALPAGVTDPTFAFDQITGGIVSIPLDDAPAPLSQFRVITRLDSVASAWVTVNQAGRSTVCAPAGSKLQEVAC